MTFVCVWVGGGGEKGPRGKRKGGGVHGCRQMHERRSEITMGTIR